MFVVSKGTIICRIYFIKKEPEAFLLSASYEVHCKRNLYMGRIFVIFSVRRFGVSIMLSVYAKISKNSLT